MMRALVTLLGLATASGCAVLASPRAPVDAHWVRHAPHAQASCLIAYLPGLGDRGSDFMVRGIVRDAMALGVPCDLLLVDAHFGYHREQIVAERVRDDVLIEARRRGYARVYLVGVSLGGLSAILAAREAPQLVDGVILVAPLLGLPFRTREVVGEIERAGGLSEWSPGSPRRERHILRDSRSVWGWLAEHTREESDGPRLWLGYGASDRFAWKHDVLAQALDPDRVVRVDGGHDWHTWRRALRELMTRVDWLEP